MLVRILMLGWELPPHNSGGLGVACYQLCKSLSKKGADIEFILPYTADHKIEFMRVTAAHPQDAVAVQAAGTAYSSAQYTMADGRINYLDLQTQCTVYEQAVGRMVQMAEFDIIHAHDWLTCRAGLRAKMLTGKPLVVHFHSVESDRAGKEGGGNPLVREIESLALLIADKVVTVSKHTKRCIVREYGIPPGKIEVVHNCFDPQNLLAAEGRNAYAYLEALKTQGYRIVVSVGRLTIQKGLTGLLYAMKAVVERSPKTMLLFVGSGEQRNELIQLAADLGLAQNVIFADFQRGKRYRDAYAVADLFVMPSISEPFGLVALEAIGYGAPVLVSKQSGVAEVVPNCLKVDFWDIDEMANQIAAVIQNDALRNELHANSLLDYQRLSWDDSASKLWGIYREHTSPQGVAA